jgi:hypothetical protein
VHLKLDTLILPFYQVAHAEQAADAFAIFAKNSTMSFGFSIGDFVTVGNLAWSVFRSCKAAPGEFQELSKEVSSLHTALKELEDEASDPQSLLNRRGARRKDELFMIRDNIETALQQLDDIVKRYQSLGRREKKTWDRVRFAAEDLDAIRGKLVFHTSAISLFLQSLSVGSLGRIEGVLEDLVREVRAGKKEKTLLSACGEEEEEDYDAFAWAELKRELEEEGISGQDIEKYKDAIKIHLKNLVGDNRDGDGEAETTDRASTGSGDWRSDDEWESASQREGLDKIETPYSKDMGPDGSSRARLDKPFADPPLDSLEANLLREASPRFAKKDETFDEARELPEQRTFRESFGDRKKSSPSTRDGNEGDGWSSRGKKKASPNAGGRNENDDWLSWDKKRPSPNAGNEKERNGNEDDDWSSFYKKKTPTNAGDGNEDDDWSSWVEKKVPTNARSGNEGDD